MWLRLCKSSHLEDVVAYIVDLDGWCAVAFVYLRAKQALKTGRCCDENNLVAVKYFILHSTKTSATEDGASGKKRKSLIQFERESKVSSHETHLNVTSLSSGLLTNFGSMRDPFTGCTTVSFMGFIGSQPKHVLKISASSKVVPSFCKHDTNNIKKKNKVLQPGRRDREGRVDKREEKRIAKRNFSIARRFFSRYF